MNTFIVQNGLNTSYLDSTLVALFYKSSHIDQMLSQEPEDVRFIYLQELILSNFINPIKRNFSINSDVVNEIRNTSVICGWKHQGNTIDLYNVLDYYKFLVNGLGCGNINFELIEFNGKKNEIIKSISVYCLEIDIFEHNTIKNLINDWITKNITTHNEEFSIYYQFREIPMIIPIYLNRKNKNGDTVLCQVDIMKKIRFKKKNIKYQNMFWTIHSVICFSNSGGGNYYTITNTNNNWYMFSNDRIPSLLKINMDDKFISEKIKKESVLIFYRLSDELCKY